MGWQQGDKKSSDRLFNEAVDDLHQQCRFRCNKSFTGRVFVAVNYQSGTIIYLRSKKNIVPIGSVESEAEICPQNKETLANAVKEFKHQCQQRMGKNFYGTVEFAVIFQNGMIIDYEGQVETVRK